ncbi:MAG: penicillin-binding protein 2 [bacterium]|nr:penicillin-binding protein 2 [bacterium]
MSHTPDPRLTFNRRSLILRGGKIILFGALIGRMGYLQLMRSPYYRTLADENRIKLKFLSPKRGTIFDRQLRPLAQSEVSFQAVITPEDVENLEISLKALSELIYIPEEHIKEALIRSKKQPSHVPLSLKSNLSWEELSRLKVHAPDLPGVSAEDSFLRHYTAGKAVAHLLGYVRRPSEEDLTRNPEDSFLKLPGIRLGKTGIEKKIEKALRGVSGVEEVEVTARRKKVRTLSQQLPKEGQSVQLTIDLELQKKAQQLLEPYKSGAAVVMDVQTGHVFAFSSEPSFDNNAFVQRLPPEIWNGLSQDPLSPLVNKVTSGTYAPGSTFKMVVALAALEAELITRHDTVTCYGHVSISNHRFHCHKRGGHGTVSLLSALYRSCDIYFYDLALKVGIERIAKMAKILGLGEITGLDFPDEKPGLIPIKNWKKKRYNKSWLIGETVIASIGQGYLLATPLQLAVMTARIASGKMISPSLLSEQGTSPAEDLPISEKNLQIVREGMRDVVWHPQGTAKSARSSALKIAGKTGTSQVRRITTQERKQGVRRNQDMDWKYRDHALFVGFAPLDKPRYAVAIIIEHGGSGSRIATPIARELLLKTAEVVEET